MSNYNWERGSIKIPSKEWKRFRDYIVDDENKRRTETLNEALRVWAVLSKRENIQAAREAVKRHNKTLKPNERRKLKDVTPLAIYEALNDSWSGGLKAALKGVREVAGVELTFRRGRDRWGGRTDASSDYYDRKETVKALLFPYIYEKDERGYQRNVGRKRLAKPKKSDDRVKQIASTKVKTISNADASLTFDHKAKTVHWDVDENNRAQEAARDSHLWSVLSTALGRVTWTRGTGGKIIGNDEYNRDDDYEGGGANYVTAEFGPKPKKDPYAKAYRKSGYYRQRF